MKHFAIQSKKALRTQFSTLKMTLLRPTKNSSITSTIGSLKKTSWPKPRRSKITWTLKKPNFKVSYSRGCKEVRSSQLIRSLTVPLTNQSGSLVNPKYLRLDQVLKPWTWLIVPKNLPQILSPPTNGKWPSKQLAILSNRITLGRNWILLLETTTSRSRFGPSKMTGTKSVSPNCNRVSHSMFW